MILKHIYLYLNTSEYAKGDLNSQFQFRTRSLCNFLERRLKGTKFKADGFSKICVQGREHPEDDCRIVPEHALVAEVYFDQSLYENLQEGKFHEFFIAMLVKGLQKCQRHHPIPLHLLLATVEEFRAGGYQNRWEHKTKVLRNHALKARLGCELTMHEFVLTLSIYKGDHVAFEKQILRTKPDEIIFAHQFKDVTCQDDTLVVSNKFGKTLYALKLPELIEA